MLPETVATRYSLALLEVATSEQRVDEVFAELQRVSSILKKHHALTHALESPTISAAVKKSILKRLFGSQISKMVLSFLFLLVDKKREAYIPDIVKQYQRLMDQAQNRIAAVVESASELPGETRDRLVAQLEKREGKTVQVEWKVNPDLIGGFVVRIGDRMLDMSFRSQLEDIQARLSS